MDINSLKFEEKNWGKALKYFQDDLLEAGIFQCDPGCSLEKHNHTEGDEYIFILNGKGGFRIENDEKEAQKGDVVRIPKSKLHYVFNSTQEPLLCAYIVLSK